MRIAALAALRRAPGQGSGITSGSKRSAWRASLFAPPLTVSAEIRRRQVRSRLPAPPHLSHCYRMFFWTLDGFELVPKLPRLTPDTPFRRGLMRPVRSGQRVADIAKISYAGFGGTAEHASAGMWVGFTRENIPPRACSARHSSGHGRSRSAPGDRQRAPCRAYPSAKAAQSEPIAHPAAGTLAQALRAIVVCGAWAGKAATDNLPRFRSESG